jgi:hypothetical protein
MRFNFCIACSQKITCYEDGKIFCKSRGIILPPIFCESFRDREVFGINDGIIEVI